MKFTYAPEDPADGERQEWQVDLRRIRQSESELMEKTYGGTKDEWDHGVLAGDSRARKVLMWHLMRRDHPRMQYRDVPDFYTGEVEVELDLAELERLRTQIAETAGLPDHERAKILDAIDAQIAEKQDAGTVIDGELVPAGKARSRTSAASTG